MKSPFARYMALTIVVIGILGAILSMAFRGPGDWQAVWTSAAVAVSVQLVAFGLGRLVGGGAVSSNLMARMGIGALVRFLAVVAYALLVATVLHLPLVAALISLVTFFFLSTLIEPVLIRS